MNNPIEHQVMVCIDTNQLNEMIDLINQDNYDKPPVTLEEVRGNKKLRDYLCKVAVAGASGDLDSLYETWNADGFCDFQYYR